MRAPTTVGDTSRFRPMSRRRTRLAAGAALGAIAIGGNVFVYASLDDTEPAVQVTRDVPAGEQITADMLRTVNVDVDSSVNIVAGDEATAVVGRYARVRLVSGSLVTREALQTGPLVAPGNAVVAVRVDDGSLPRGLRERVPVRLVIPADRNAEASEPRSFDGRVVGLPVDSSSGLGTTVSVELGLAEASIVAASDDVRIALLAPSPDPAAQAES